ncbi:unnamed protein product [Linum tenue]|uniref:Uncharacterized protein n=1 Tax=Linum tenue TaxID=586396 RepID=A0AAV0LZA5_9ROSI|nr:unnamed protein product [Linum tenue]
MLKISIPVDAKTRSCLCRTVFPAASLILVVFFIGTSVLVPDHKQSELQALTRSEAVGSFSNLNSTCNCQERPQGGGETLRQGKEPERPQETKTLPQSKDQEMLQGRQASAEIKEQEMLQGNEKLPQSKDQERPRESETLPQRNDQENPQATETLPESIVHSNNLNSANCQDREMPQRSETLPQGIIQKTSNLQMRPLWGNVAMRKPNEKANLFAAAVGVKQKVLVNKMVTKFLSSSFTVMLFHYDDAVDEWREFDWNSNVVHVSAHNQTKWWFAKRFMHPDIVAEYDYVFLWDEDIGVDTFDPLRYLSIVSSEGLEISQPALDVGKSEIHQQITARINSIVHRLRIYKPGSCERNNTSPPCTGWVEMMAPVFSRDAWRCVWYMIQNDLIHAWGLDYRLGYCAQGDRTQKMGVVDAEYVVHHGKPTLGESKDSTPPRPFNPREFNPRVEVRRQSWNEYKTFKQRWAKAAEEDKCWIDPYNDDPHRK